MTVTAENVIIIGMDMHATWMPPPPRVPRNLTSEIGTESDSSRPALPTALPLMSLYERERQLMAQVHAMNGSKRNEINANNGWWWEGRNLDESVSLH